MTRELKGWHVATVFVMAFGVIIAVNLTLAFKAVATFPGLEVKNSYVASQSFDRERHAQEALGWDVTAEVRGGLLRVDLRDEAGRAVDGVPLQGLLGRPTHVRADRQVRFVQDGSAYVAPVALEAGLWALRLEAVAPDGTAFRKRLMIAQD